MTLSREAQQHQDVTKREFVMTVCEPELILEANKKLAHFPHKPLGPVQHWIILYSNHFLGTWSWIQNECLQKKETCLLHYPQLPVPTPTVGLVQAIPPVAPHHTGLTYLSSLTSSNHGVKPLLAPIELRVVVVIRKQIQFRFSPVKSVQSSICK